MKIATWPWGGGGEEEKACGGWNIAVMRKMRSSCTFYGISERFLESRGCIKIFNTFIQFANEVSGGMGSFCVARWLKKWFVKWEERLHYESCICRWCAIYLRRNYFTYCTFYNLNTSSFEARNWRCEEYFQGRKKRNLWNTFINYYSRTVVNYFNDATLHRRKKIKMFIDTFN